MQTSFRCCIVLKKGYAHGDLHRWNYSISGNEENSQVNVFDFDRFYKLSKRDVNKFRAPEWDLDQILKRFIVLACEILGAGLKL